MASLPGSECLGANRARPVGDPQSERPTLHCLGVYWIISGDDNRNAVVRLEFRVERDFDYEGFGAGPFRRFLHWNRALCATLEDVRKRAPVLRHAVQVDAATAFASGALPPHDVAKPSLTPPDLRLALGSKAVDAGEVLPGRNDGFHGGGPDLGAYVLGDPLPHYRPRVGTNAGDE
jgi:hypothetical protein